MRVLKPRMLTTSGTAAMSMGSPCGPWSWLICGLVWLIVGSSSLSQVILREGRGVIIARPAIQLNAIPQRTATDPLRQGGASLKTDPDLEAILEKAKRYVADENYSVAAQLWQAVLEKCGDTLYSQDDITYYSMIDQVEGTLASLPAEALRVYRVTADAEAKQILARAGNPFDATALGQVVRRYFLSSLGDEAALQLASLLMDRHDFVGALRLLEKVRERHPDPSVPPHEVQARLALCHLLVGEYEVGVQLAQELAASERGGDLARSLTPLLTRSAEELASEFQLTSSNSYRSFRVQPNVPDDFLAGNLYGGWQLYHDLSADGVVRYPDVRGNVITPTEGEIDSVADSVSQEERALTGAWEQYQWRPSPAVLIDGEQVYFKTIANLMSLPTALAKGPSWRSVWLNQFEFDDLTRAMEQIRNSYGNQPGFDRPRDGTRLPGALREIQHFGDLIPWQMTKIGNAIYALEGKNYDINDNPQADLARRRGFQYNTALRRTRSNVLVAYEADTGRVLWTLPKNSTLNFRSPTDRREAAPAANDRADNPGATPSSAEEPWLTAGGFMGPPLAYNKLLLVPVNIGGATYVYCLDPAQQGKTVWRTYLCDEPETGAPPWAPITLTLDGTDLFAASGMGVLFVLDPANGVIRFAQRYRRDGTPNQALANIGWQMSRLDFDGWEEDLIVPYGRQMICFCSDSQQIFAIDRSTAERIWETDINPLGYRVDYLIGVQNDVLYAGGRHTIIAFDLQGEGRMLWGGEQLFDGGTSMGRAMLCQNGLYVPVNDTILRFDISKPQEAPRLDRIAHVNLGNHGPVGNLYSDGQRIWIQGLNRLIATMPVTKGQEQPAPAKHKMRNP